MICNIKKYNICNNIEKRVTQKLLQNIFFQLTIMDSIHNWKPVSCEFFHLTLNFTDLTYKSGQVGTVEMSSGSFHLTFTHLTWNVGQVRTVE